VRGLARRIATRGGFDGKYLARLARSSHAGSHMLDGRVALTAPSGARFARSFIAVRALRFHPSIENPQVFSQQLVATLR